MFTRELRHAGHVLRFSIRQSADGWELREEQDSELLHRERYRDWHRVERAMMRIDSRVSELEELGWASSD